MVMRRVRSVDDLARRYARVLLSRRLLRAFAVGTLLAAVMLLGLTVAVPVVLAIKGTHPSTWLVLAGILGLLGTIVAAAVGLVVVYVRALSALARGSRRATTTLLTVVGI